jgi:hypothetical protein
MKGAATALFAAFLTTILGLLSAAALLGGQASACVASGTAGSVDGLPSDAERFADLYAGAAAEYELGARGASILAAIHEIESGFGSNMGPSTAGAVGHMQFLPSTWSQYGVDADGDGEADPSHPADAIYSAANYLKASGAPGDWRRALFAYNHATWYVEDVLREAREFGALTSAVGVCDRAAASADLKQAIRVFEPAHDFRVPARYMAGGRPSALIDARVWPNVRWLLDAYDLVLTAGKETGHASHGDGSAIDAVPARSDSLGEWERTTERAATDLGWTSECAPAGVRPACDLVPAIEFVGYNGYDSAHGDPAHSDTPHLHVSWVSETHGTPHLTTPEWILVFPMPTVS